MSDLDIFPYPVSRLGQVDIGLASSLQELVEGGHGKELEVGKYEQLLQPSLRKIFAEVGLQRMFWPEESGVRDTTSPPRPIRLFRHWSRSQSRRRPRLPGRP